MCHQFFLDLVENYYFQRQNNNYLEDYQSFDINASYLINFRDFKASVAIFGQNLNDNSQVLEGISIFDKRFYLSLGIQWK